MLYIGCHLSSSGGYAAMGKTALEIGANTFQFFTRNPRGGKAKELDPADAAALWQMQQDGLIGPIVAHAPYTVNPCSADERTRQFAKEMMTDDFARMEYIPGNYYNFHPGSHVGQGLEEGIRLITECLDAVMFDGMKTTVLLETMAGKGSEVGGHFEELAEIIARVQHPEAMGVCLDTCHVSDGGYDITADLSAVLDEFDRVIGLGRLKALHLNDSKNPLGAHKDRHEKIGEGFLGLDLFRAVVNEPRLHGLPMVLETPNELDGYQKEIALLRSLEA